MFPTTLFDLSPKYASSSSFVTEVGIFFSILLFQLSIFYFFLPESLRCCSLQPIFLFCQDHALFLVYPFNQSVVSSAQVLSILSSFISLFNRSAVRICNSLFLFPTGVLSTSFISVVFFSRYGLTFSRFLGFTRLSKKQLGFTSSLFSSVFPLVPF